MKNKLTNRVAPIDPQEIAALQRKIANAKKRRTKLFAAIEENPSAENQQKLARLEKTIETDSDKLHLQAVAGAGATLDGLIAMLADLSESQDEAQLLESGDNAPICEILETVRAVRNRFFDSTMILSRNEQVKAFLKKIDDAVNDTEAKIKEKRRRAAENFPELARKFRQPDYEMPENYNDVLRILSGFIEKREWAVKNLKNVHPKKLKEYKANLAELDRLINEGEQRMADSYDYYQKKQRYIDGFRKFLAGGSKTERWQLREYLKQNPGAMPDAEKLLREEFSEEDDF